MSTMGLTNTLIGYSNEVRRGELLSEMLYLAFACNLARTASMMLSHTQSTMSAAGLLGELPSGIQLDLHACSHMTPIAAAQMQNIMARINAWHVDVFARLVSRLKSAPDGADTLLDNTAVVLAFEGGIGHDYQTGENGSPHSTENMTMLYAGARMNRAGQHTDGGRAHPAQLFVAAMRAVGVSDALGEINTPLAGIAP
jgi:hypothetical protein